MQESPSETLQALVKHLDRYSEEAFLFVREGLAFAAEQIHGRETEAHRHLYQYLAANELDWTDLVTQYYSGALPEPVLQAVEAAGGCEKLNRHVSGRELCWGFRDFAFRRWGMLARLVLASWSINTTRDFGAIVFGFIDFNLMQKQEEDRLEDFEDVYDFGEAFDESFRISPNGDDNGDSDAD